MVQSAAGGSVVSVEPGGAVELPGPPADGVFGITGADARSAESMVGACQCRAGFGLPADPPGRRCGPIRAHAIGPWSSFAASHSGVPRGDDDLDSRDPGQSGCRPQKDGPSESAWHALGPTMIAIAANS